IDRGVKPARAAMIGDDIDSDIGGAQAAGMKGILVKTGKYRQELVKKSNVKPDMVVDSINELYNVL
ncbi:MAG: HAD hydrolase-like protein, partial [candidate division Zixibacteria bacterium]|nr:HAD hydrolase-like protein [candidate division Zixibacteria bacterium]